MSRASFAAYKRIKQSEHEAHLLKTYGMLPIRARHAGKCGCGRHDADKFGPGDTIVKFRGAWWATHCVDAVRFEEFRATCRFVRQIHVAGAWRDLDWTDDAAAAQVWREMEEFEDDGQTRRVLDRRES